MLTALIAAGVTLVILIAAVGAFFFLRGRAQPRARAPKVKIHAIKTVGVVPEDKGATPRVNTPASSASPLSETLRPRFLAVCVLAAAIFGSLGAKVWSLQILSGEKYREMAQENLYKRVLTPAPRGCIYDAAGVPLVRNRTSLAVLADPEVADNRPVVQRLSATLGIPHNIVRQRIKDASSGAQSQRLVASDVRLRDAAFISEHTGAFPGVTTQSRTVREYPFGALAAHALGYTGSTDEADVENRGAGANTQLGDIVGKEGIEAAYNHLLAGDHGERRVVADADGAVRRVVSETDPVQGNDIYLTIQAPVQYAVDRMLAELVAPVDNTIGTGKGIAASAVVLDATDGSVVALSSFPTYTPESFIGGISTDTWELYDHESRPLLNRAVAGEYPPASTYKAFTGLAALAYGFAGTDREWECTGSWDGFGTGDWQKCWLRTGHGAIGFREGIVHSCDVVFYNIAKDFWSAAPMSGGGGTLSDTAMQDYIEKYGYGVPTGIDVRGEAAGRVPDGAWKARHFKDAPQEASWLGGDMSNMVIGQGYVLATPLQVAASYAGIATGKIMKPHLFKEARNSAGEVVVAHTPEVVATPDVPAAHLAIVRDALRGVATENADVAKLFAHYGIEAAAKTGTAEKTDRPDSAWFACYAPYDNPKYVVTCMVEEGGGGGAVAAPLGVDIMNAVLAYDAGTLDPTMGAVAGFTGKKIEPKETDSTGRTD